MTHSIVTQDELDCKTVKPLVIEDYKKKYKETRIQGRCIELKDESI